MKERDRWLQTLEALVERGREFMGDFDSSKAVLPDIFYPTVLHTTKSEQDRSTLPQVTFRQVGDGFPLPKESLFTRILMRKLGRRLGHPRRIWEDEP